MYTYLDLPHTFLYTYSSNVNKNFVHKYSHSLYIYHGDRETQFQFSRSFVYVLDAMVRHLYVPKLDTIRDALVLHGAGPSMGTYSYKSITPLCC